MIAVIIGGTGLVGSLLTKKVLEDSTITELIFISRRPSAPSHSKIKEVILSDFSQLNQIASSLKGDFYFCCLGTTIKDAGSPNNFEKIDYHAVVDFAKIAESHRAQCFSLISAYGANAHSRFFYSQVKGRAEDAIKKLKLNRLVIFKPSLLLGNRIKFRLGEKISISAVNVISFILPSKLRKKIGTKVEPLASQLKAEGIKTDPGIFIFEADQI